MTARPPNRTGPLALALAALVVAAGALAAWTTDATAPAPARAASSNRAVIVIDDGVHRTSTCVRFDAPSITGMEALRRAVEPDPVTASFGSSEAVCGIGGVGCPASGCLTCQAPAYWHYFRTGGGASLRYSGTGASSTTVRDGDVEAWVWGSTVSGGAVPQLSSVCGLEPPDPPPTVSPTSAPPAAGATPSAQQPGPGPGVAPGAGAVSPAPDGGGTGPAAPPADASATDTSDPTSTSPPGTDQAPGDEGSAPDDDVDPAFDRDVGTDPETEEEVAGQPLASRGDDRSGSSLLAILVFATLVAGSVAGVVVLRRRPPAGP